MDVIIPSHNIKTFASSITTLSKIGKILYLEFDPLDGLSIRTLNDAKSCFVYFHFEVGFFERCSSSLDSWKTQTLKNKKNKNRNRRGESGESGRSRVVSNSRRRRRIRRRTTSLNRNSTTNSSRNGGNKRNRSQSAQRRDKDNEGNNNNKDKDDKMSEEEETNHHSDSDNSNDDNDNNNNDNNENNESDNDDDNDEKYLCKVPIKTVATILRSRKGLLSLRIRSVTSSSSSSSSNKHNQHHRDDVDNDYNMDIENDNDDDDDDEIGSQMQLSFEYQIQSNGIMHITHKVNLSNADGIIALAPKQHCSEIITIPQVLLTMLDQVKSTSEVALTVNDDLKKVVASSFHYGFYNNASSNENGGGGSSSSNGNGNGNDNLMMNMATAAILKTETSVDCNDFEDFHYMDDFAVERVMAEEEKETLTAVDGADATGGGPDIPPPATIAKEVTLVFSIKEAKAMLQFCASSNSNSNYMDGEEANVIVSFYWGGRPVIIETEGEAFRGELILATVDHSLLNGITNRYTSSSSTTKTNHSSSGAREAEGAARRRSR